MYSQNYQEYCSRVRAVVEKSQEDEGGDYVDEDGEDGEEGSQQNNNGDAVEEAEAEEESK